MQKSINTLVPDIEELLIGRLEVPHEDKGIGERLYEVFSRGVQPKYEDKATRVWFSNVGSKCLRQLWYRVNLGDKAEPFRANTLLKFMYGNLIEEIVLELARLTGHVVEAEQERVEWGGISGRIDAVIDGHLVDVKSASSMAFKKFQGGLKPDSDSFGYLTQLGGYLSVVRDTRQIDRNRASFLAIDKSLGTLHLDTHEWSDKELEDLKEMMAHNKKVAEQTIVLPERGFEVEDDGYKKDGRLVPNGNKKLGVNCSYCDFKNECYPDLRTFIYSGGPQFFTKVVKEPKVPEVKKDE